MEKYAELVIKKGVNLQEDQVLYVNAPVDGVSFVRLVAEKAYEQGAKEVVINWSDDRLTYLKYKHANEAVFEHFPEWAKIKQESYAKEGAAFLSIHSTDPDLLQGVDGSRIANANKAAGLALTEFRKILMNDEVQWCVISIPTLAWAQKIFPEQSGEDAMQSLWEEIIKMVRVDLDDPLSAWDDHNAILKHAYEYLNEKQYDKLVLTAPGTNLEIGLPVNHIWQGGAAVSEKGIVFNPNMPTEEVFTMPHKYRVDGTVTSTKPLNYGGNLIDEFTLTFKDGQVVDYTAKQGGETLEHLLETDDGARRIGEIALVPNESPVSQSGLIFYNTLFDENASVHIALGKAYPTNIEGGAQMDEDALDKHGVNDSMVHVDFMVGSAEMNIDGVTKEGQTEQIFVNGTWAIDI